MANTEINNEPELLASFKKGDPIALKEIYALYTRQLCFFCEELISDTLAAEDIAAETFIKAYNRREEFASLEKLKGFLFVVANNASMDYLRATKRKKIKFEEIGSREELITEDAQQAFIRSEAIHTIYQAIENLPPQCRQVVKLSFIEGLKPEEIAARLQMNYQTVRNQKTLGVKALRIALVKNNLLSVEVLAAALLLLEKWS